MFKASILPSLLAALALPLSAAAGPLIYKCTIDGAVTYQRDPCPPSEKLQGPTVGQLNAERQKKLRQAENSAAASAAGAHLASKPSGGSGALLQSEGQRQSSAAANQPSGSSFKCDGRTHCSQMSSCAEAKYFLSHCPGVKMDGDRNGIPCEKQWCNK